MKFKKVISKLLSMIMVLGLLAGCGGSEAKAADLPTEANGAALPGDEYDRGIWYGFMPAELANADPSKVVTWKQYCAMLGNMIERYQPEVLPEWEAMTADAPDTKMKRDGAAIALLYAAKTVDLHYCNRDKHEVYNEDYSWGHHFSWDYPIFDWQSPIQLIGELAEGVYDDENAIATTYWFLLGKISCITFQPMLEVVNGDPNLEGDLTCRDAIISVVRLYESVESVAQGAADKFLEQVLNTEEGKRIAEEAKARKAEILNSETKIVKSDTFVQGETYTGTAYYVSNQGNDSANGKSPETAWATIDRLSSVRFKYGDAIFFERGGTWRKVQMPDSVRSTEGLTLSAYGEGEKPKLWGSPENGTGAEKWTLHYEGPNGEKIWKFYHEMTDCSVIVLNGKEMIKRDLAYWDGSKYLCIEDFSVPYSMEKQMKDMELFVELPYTQSPMKDNDETNSDYLGRFFEVDKNGNPLTGPLYVRCDKGNPGELYKEIEFITAYKAFDGMANDTTLDNLCFGYSTYTITSGYYDGVSSDHVMIQNCESGWNGGALKWFGANQNAAGFGHVEMSGGGFNVNGSYETVQNCYIHHAFQEGIALETFIGDKGPCTGNTIRDNVIEYCLFGIGTANWETETNTAHILKDIRIENNYSLYNGFETLYNYPSLIKDENSGDIHWPSRIGYVIIDAAAFSATEGGDNYRIIGNTFAFSVSQLIQHSELDHPTPPDYEGNTYAVLPGFAYSSILEGGGGPLVTNHDASSVIEDFLGDKTATVITFE